MNAYYNQNYTKEEIIEYLNIVKECVINRRVSILRGPTRQKNTQFIDRYNIRFNKQLDIINNIHVDDFCHTLISTNQNHAGDILYVFAPQVELHNIDNNIENVCIYIKIQVCETRNGNRTIAISFHELERPIEYAFH